MEFPELSKPKCVFHPRQMEQQQLARFPSHPQVVLELHQKIDRNCNFEEPIDATMHKLFA